MISLQICPKNRLDPLLTLFFENFWSFVQKKRRRNFKMKKINQTPIFELKSNKNGFWAKNYKPLYCQKIFNNNLFDSSTQLAKIEHINKTLAQSKQFLNRAEVTTSKAKYKDGVHTGCQRSKKLTQNKFFLFNPTWRRIEISSKFQISNNREI